MSDELKNLSHEMLSALEEETRKVLKAEDSPPDPFYGMMQYHMGWLDERLAVMESATAIKRAGADLIITYFAEQLADWLGE